MYAIVKTGGKQYHVEEGRWLIVERLPAQVGDTITLTPLLYVDGDDLLDGDGLAAVHVQARVLAHERGPKLRIVKFKPKRGYKRRTGHRQDLTRIEVTSIARQAKAAAPPAAKAAKARADSPVAAVPRATAPVAANPATGDDDNGA